MNKLRKIFILLFGIMASVQVMAQDKIVHPDISYAGTPRTLTLGGINVSGVEVIRRLCAHWYLGPDSGRRD